MLSPIFLVAALCAPAQSPEAAVSFAFGDVFARDLATLGEQLALALEREPAWDVLFDYGALTPRGTSFGLFGPTAQSVYFVVPDGPPSLRRGVEHRTIEVVARGANGAPAWDRVESVVHVTRPAGADAATHARVLRWLTGGVDRPVAVQGVPSPATGAAAPVRRPEQLVVAHGLTPTDLRADVFVGAGGRVFAWERLGHEHRAQHTLRRIDLSNPAVGAYAAATLWPQGVPGTRVLARADHRYDSPGIDLGRGVVEFDWSAATASQPWVGFVMDLRDVLGGPLDASDPNASVSFSVRGTTTQPSASPRLFVVLEDVHAGGNGLGNEGHVAIELNELSTFEQQVVIPLYQFQFANQALDRTSLVHLKIAARDANIPGSQSALTGDLELYEPRIVVDSPERRTPQNVFWSNDPVAHAAGGPGAPLSERFLGQSTSVFKWFAGFGGASTSAVPGLMAQIDAVLAAGRVPHVVMELWPAAGADTLASIASGGYDAFFRALFEACRAREGRIELAPLHEANGYWYPWSSNGREALLRDGWRRIAGLRDAADANNVALAYVVSNLPGDAGLTSRAVAAFPGDRYVDMIGLQGFESGYDTVVDSYNELFTNILSALDVLSDLPVVITEYGFHTINGAQQPKGQLYRWALEDQVAGRAPAPILGAWTFNVAKQENGAWRDWRVYDDQANVVSAMVPWAQSLVALANHPLLASPTGADAHTQAVRAHARIAARLAPR
ncbi:MAG: glycosyl hydrolase [Planctomycetota bacterium]